MASSWKKGPYRERVVQIQPVHKQPLKLDDRKKEELPKRWIVWAITNDGKYLGDERVWIRTVEDNSDKLLLRLRSLLVKAFFEQLVGQEIEFDKYRDECYQECYSATEAKLPDDLLLDKFTRIYTWCEKNHPEWLENDLEMLRKKKNQVVAATKKKNADALAERRRKALQLTFIEGVNPKWGDKQWQTRHAGRLYVLQRGTKYNPSEGVIPVEEDFHLVPDRVILVRRI